MTVLIDCKKGMVYPSFDSSKQISKKGESFAKSFVVMFITCINRLIPETPELVIDVGCGTGNITDHFDDWLSCQKVIGLDISNDMIEYAKKFHAAKGMIYKTADIADNTTSDFKEKILGNNGLLSDLVISIHCLHWVPEPNQNAAMANIRSLMKPGGRCYLWIFSWSDMLPLQEQMVYHVKWRKYFKSVIEEAAGETADRKTSTGLDAKRETEKRRRRSSAPFPTFDPPSAEERIRIWKQRCKDLYFENYDVVLKKVDFDFENWSSFKEILKSICHFLPYIPKDEQQSFLEDYYDHVNNTYIARKAAIGSNRLYVLDYECIVVTASKPLREGNEQQITEL
jgi:SAM-dependent methyltransferase